MRETKTPDTRSQLQAEESVLPRCTPGEDARTPQSIPPASQNGTRLTSNFEIVTPDPRLQQLLELMQALGTQWAASPEIRLRVLGLHCLEDWKTLALYAEAHP